jgi:hypothetical protein
MRHANPRATAASECVDALRLARDPSRLQHAPAGELVTAAATLARGLVRAVESGGLKPQRAAAVDLLDGAGRAIGAELRRRG